jgi:hypothetical protein
MLIHFSTSGLFLKEKGERWIPYCLGINDARLTLEFTGTEVVGIFRISGSTRRMRELQIIFETPPRYGKNIQWQEQQFTPHDVASIFRRFLTSMPVSGDSSFFLLPSVHHRSPFDHPLTSPTIHGHGPMSIRCAGDPHLRPQTLSLSRSLLTHVYNPGLYRSRSFHILYTTTSVSHTLCY